MTGTWNWTFFGFETPASNRPVQDWFYGLPEDAQDDARDILGDMQHLPNHLWRRPEFDQLDNGISEIRFDGKAGTFRFYGYFGPRGQRQTYTLLHGAMKKKSKDRAAQELAEDRRDQIERGEARVYEFKF